MALALTNLTPHGIVIRRWDTESEPRVPAVRGCFGHVSGVRCALPAETFNKDCHQLLAS